MEISLVGKGVRQGREGQRLELGGNKELKREGSDHPFFLVIKFFSQCNLNK